MIFKTFIDTGSVALGANDFEVRVFVTLAIDSAEDYITTLRKWDLTPVDRSKLCANAERELAAWEAERLEEYRDYMDDMAIIDAGFAESTTRYLRWFGKGAI